MFTTVCHIIFYIEVGSVKCTFSFMCMNCFLRLVNKKYEINCRIMALRPKREFTTLREQDALLKAFYNELDEGESFLGMSLFLEMGS